MASGKVYNALNEFIGHVEQEGGYYKYTAGTFKNYNQAVSYRDQVENLPEVEGAFVVAYRDGKRIPITSVIPQ